MRAAQLQDFGFLVLQWVAGCASFFGPSRKHARFGLQGVFEPENRIVTVRFLFTMSLFAAVVINVLAADSGTFDYRVLATTKTSTMEKELNEAAEAGYAFAGVMGGESAFGGKEVVVVMIKDLQGTEPTKRSYKLLAASRTGTLEKELQQAGDEGFDYCGQTIFESAFGGKEVSVILERNPARGDRRIEYKLLATSRTSTLQKELSEAGGAGFQFLGVMIGKSAFGGKEVVSILRKYH